MPDAGLGQQRVLIGVTAAFFRFKKAAVTKKGHQHPPFDLVVLVLLAQIDFERAVRDEENVLAQKPLLHVVVENIGKRVKLDDSVNAAAPHGPLARRKVPDVGTLATFRGNDQISQPLRTRAVSDLERGMASDRA